ncbi:centrosomal protein of 164 kDa-like [Acanthaster planci]|uniref:Centrosomal protein of 164 kDa n=1 Tax=Acanthaster planci TaxID=133434 RepID=A0A8B7ZA03_ACAPL|nr:centrosomal protein of 164 kDa-like [Acanthaster planci]
MMGDQLILEEDYDENYQATEEEILEYAQVIGIDVDKEKDLMWIAREGISAPLPSDWKPCQDTTGGDIYYFNFASGESTWDHPCDEFYRKMVNEEREKKRLMGGGAGAGGGGGAGGGSGGGGGKKDKKKKDKTEKKGKEKKDVAGKKLGGPLGPLKGESTLGSTLGGTGTLGSTRGTGQLNPLGSLKGAGSTLGSTLGKSGANLGGTADSSRFLKSNAASQKKSQSMSLKGAREENIQMMPDFSDEDSGTPRLNLDLDLQDVGGLGYDDSESSDGKLKGVEVSDDDDDFDRDFGRLNLMDADDLTPAVAEEPEPIKSRFLKSNKKEETNKKDDAKEEKSGGAKQPPAALAAMPAIKVTSVLDTPTVAADPKPEAAPAIGEAEPEIDLRALAEKRERLEKDGEEEMQNETEESLAKKREEYQRDREEQEAKLRKDHETSLAHMRKKLEKELEDAKLELLDDKEDRMRKLKQEAEQTEEEEAEKLQKERDKTIRELRKKVKEDTEEEEAMLMEGKSDAMRKLKETIRKDQQEQEDKLRADMDETLKTLRDEVRDLQENETAKLELEKKKMMDAIKKEVGGMEETERRELQDKSRKVLDDLRHKLESEERTALSDLQKAHDAELEKKTKEMKQKHEREMDDVRARLQEAQAEEKRREEDKLRLSREKQSAVRDMEGEMENVLKERKQEMKEEQKKELEKMRREHESNMKTTKREMEELEKKEKLALQSQWEAEKDRLAQDFELEMREMRRDLDQRREELHRAHEEQENALRETSEGLEERQKEAEAARNALEKEEGKLRKSWEKLDAEKERLGRKQHEVLASQVAKMDPEAVKQIQEERQELLESIQEERKRSKQLEKEKEDLLATVQRLKLQAKTSPRMPQRISEEDGQDLDEPYTNGHYHQADEGSSPRTTLRVPKTPSTGALNLEELSQPTPSPSKGVRQMVHPRDLLRTPAEREDYLLEGSDEEYQAPARRRASDRVSRGRRESDRSSRYTYGSSDTDIAGLPEHRSRNPRRQAWGQLATDSDESEDFTEAEIRQRMHQMDAQARLLEENGAIRRAGEFLRRQRHILRQRQRALGEARQEWRRDLRHQQTAGLSPAGASILEDVRLGLEREALELDKAMVNMSTGHRLIREKASKIKKLEASMQDRLSGSELDANFPHLSVSNLSLSDSSTGSDTSLSDPEEKGSKSGTSPENQASAVLSQLKQLLRDQRQGPSASGPGPGVAPSSENPLTGSLGTAGDPVVSSLNIINQQLSNVMSLLQQQAQARVPSTGDNPASDMVTPVSPRQSMSAGVLPSATHTGTQHLPRGSHASGPIPHLVSGQPSHNALPAQGAPQWSHSRPPYSYPHQENGYGSIPVSDYNGYSRPVGGGHPRLATTSSYPQGWSSGIRAQNQVVPNVKFDVSSLRTSAPRETAEQALERKWKTYFGGHGLSTASTASRPGVPNPSLGKPTFGGYVSARDQLRAFRQSAQTSPTHALPNEASLPATSTETKLQQMSDWVKDFRRDDNPTTSTATPLSGRSAPATNFSQGSGRRVPSTRLELDSNNQIRVREI